MPFLLRRTKDEVLSDLPEKIIQDRYCDLSPIQLKLYEQFSGSNTKKEISTLVNEHDSTNTKVEAKPSNATSHVFQVFGHASSNITTGLVLLFFLVIFFNFLNPGTTVSAETL